MFHVTQHAVYIVLRPANEDYRASTLLVQRICHSSIFLRVPTARKAIPSAAWMDDRKIRVIRQMIPHPLAIRVANADAQSFVVRSCANQSSDFEPILDLVLRAKTEIGGAMGQKPAAPVIQSGPDRGAGCQRQRRIFQRAERRRQVMKDQHGIVMYGPEP